MKRKHSRKTRRGIKALFCFLLAAELMLGELGTSVQAEETAITDSAEGDHAASSGDTEEGDDGESPDAPEGGEDGSESPDAPEGGEDGSESPDTPEGGEDGSESPDTPEGGEDGGESPDAPEGGEDSGESPDAPEGGEDGGESPDVPDNEEIVEENPELPIVCTCDVLCTEDSVDTDCPVCAEDYLLCGGEEETEKAEEGEAEISALSEARAVKEFTIWDEGLRCIVGYTVKSTGTNEVELKKANVEGSQNMRDTVTYEGTTYSVVSIGESAFAECEDLEALTIPDSVKSIGESVFYGCSSLKSVTLPNSITEIKKSTFSFCTSLETIEIPDSVTVIGENAFSCCYFLQTMKMPDSVRKIGKAAFSGCYKLETVKIPNGVTEIGESVFYSCTGLKTVEIPASVIRFGPTAFGACTSLETLKIALSFTSEGKMIRIYAETSAFKNASKGKIIFMTSDGTAPYPSEGIDGGPTLLQVCDEYDVNEWNELKDAMWYGWELPEYSTVKVTIPVKLDGEVWENHKKSFVLKPDRGTTYITGDTVAVDGNYQIYEDTGKDGTSRYLNTQESVTVEVMNGGEVTSEPIEYYTATFYDGDEPYGDDTPQASQIVLKRRQPVTRPSEDPVKEEYVFDKWVTEKNGDSEFEFGGISAPTKIYASWMTGVYEVTINVQLDDIAWDNHGKSYALKKEGDTNSTYIVDLAHVKDGTYRIFEVTSEAGKKKYLDTGKQVIVNGAPQSVTMQYYRLVASAGEHGTIDPLGGTVVMKGFGGPAFQISAAGGYCIESVLVDGKAVDEAVGKTTYIYRFASVKEAHTIRVSFMADNADGGHELRVGIKKDNHEWTDNEKKLFVRKQGSAKYIQLDRQANGEHTVSLDNGTYRIYVSLRPNLNFDPADYPEYMDDTGVDVTVSDSDVTESLDYFTVNLTAGDHVSFPQGAVYVRSGSSAFFEIKPESRWVISSVRLDGVEVAKERLEKTRKEGGFTLLPEETVEIHRIEVDCKPANVAVWIQKNNELWPEHEKTFIFKKEGESGFAAVDSSEEDGILYACLENGRYTIYEFVQTEGGWTYQSIGTTFDADNNYQIVLVNYFTVTASAEKGGNITPSGEKIVLEGTDCDFRIQADEGYALKELRVNGKDAIGDVNEDGVYHVKNIQAKTTVKAVFEGEGGSDDEYDVTVTVNKDNAPWGTGNDKAYAFKKKDGENYTESFTVDRNGKLTAKLKSGIYGIFEVTDTTARALKYRDTQVSVEVGTGTGDGAPKAAVDYYTVTFYDGETAYGEETDQRPQIVLKNESVSQPSAPVKSGHSFDGWRTTGDGDAVFDFEGSKVSNTTKIYASWTTGQKPTHKITASAGEGGSISAGGTVTVTEGASHTFRITADAGYKIKSVLVDGVDQGAVDSYRFTNVTGDHRIEVTFEKISTGSGDSGSGDTGSSSSGGSSSAGSGHTDGSGINGSTAAYGTNGIFVDIHGNIVSMSGTTEGNRNAASSGGNVISGGVSDIKGTTGKNTAAGAVSVSGTNAVSDTDASGAGEPKTSDAFHYEVYATIAMIAGIVYLILYLLDGIGGMTEEEKERLTAALLRWAKQGKAVTWRRYIAIMAIFFVLLYYHALGKSADMEVRTA